MKSNEKGESDVTPTESETTRTAGNDPRGSWEIPEASPSSDVDRSEKARCRNADMHASGKSDSLILPEKQANNAGPQTAEESVEERRLTKENVNQFAIGPDSVPGRQVAWTAWRTRGTGTHSRKLERAQCRPSSSAVRAVCGSSARTDLCGGRPAMAVPTAIAQLVQDAHRFHEQVAAKCRES